jgi:Raf kinase inhibitor-like YbhB/YbcL family protein
MTPKLLAVAVGALLAGTPACSQTPAAAPPPGPIAMERVETRGAGTLSVTSPAFANGATLPRKYTKYYDNISPPLGWTGAPAATRAYALIVDDPDAKLKPVTHWTIWNMTAAGLPEGVPMGAQTPPPIGAVQGATTMRTSGYTGPHPPLGDPPHHYHFQVFALDAPLAAAGRADRETLLKAMAGHVLARGELVGLYGQATAPSAEQ